MSSRQGVFRYLVLLLVVSLFLVACERPLQDAGDTAEEVATQAAEEVDEVVGEEAPPETAEPEPDEAEGAVATDGETPEATEAPTEEPTEEPADTPQPEEEEAADDDASPRTGDDEEAEATPEGEAEEAAATDEEQESTAEEEAAVEEEATEDEAAADEEAAAEEEATTEEEAAAEATEEEAATEERVHVVQAGENLYRIGLQYGISWVILAEYNDITNPNAIYAGQEIRIPPSEDGDDGDDDDGATATPTPSPATETTYVVKPGDNLYRIGRVYGISWVQIAEANGIVNPNRIYAGQELKIPAEAPGPSPQFTHTVEANETLFKISLRYGVPWTTIAEANDLTSPYVIYPGQTLVIPGG